MRIDIQKARRNNLVALGAVLIAYFILALVSVWSGRHENILACNLVFCVSLIGLILDNQILDSFAVVFFPHALTVILYDISIQGFILIHVLSVVCGLIVVVMDLRKVNFKAAMMGMCFMIGIGFFQAIDMGIGDKDMYIQGFFSPLWISILIVLDIFMTISLFAFLRKQPKRFVLD